jgi:hypothetical protein
MDLDSRWRSTRRGLPTPVRLAFVFVGSFDINTMRPLVEKYVASLRPRIRTRLARPAFGCVASSRVVDRAEPKSDRDPFTGDTKPERNMRLPWSRWPMLQLRLADHCGG